MRIPDGLTSLVEHGVVDEVVRSLKSGKEAQVYLVTSSGEYRVAKVYKEAQERNFQNRAVYTEGRQVRNSRDQRAMAKGSKHGKAQNEAAWKSAEVDMIYRLQEAGVRVPKPYFFIDGVLIMELVISADGQPAPRLGEVDFAPEEAQAAFTQLLAEAVRMLAAGVVHGDLSEFNVLVGFDGPVVIDFPQAVNAASNQNARKLLLRDIENLKLFLRRFIPDAPLFPYAEEMWQLYERGELTGTTELTGKYIDDHKRSNTTAVLDLIEDARRDERFKRQLTGKHMRGLGGQPSTNAPAGHQRGPRPPQHANSNGHAQAKPHAQSPQRQPHERAPHQPQTHQPQAHPPAHGQSSQKPHGQHPPRQQHGPHKPHQQNGQRLQHPQTQHHPRPPPAQSHRTSTNELPGQSAGASHSHSHSHSHSRSQSASQSQSGSHKSPPAPGHQHAPRQHGHAQNPPRPHHGAQRPHQQRPHGQPPQNRPRYEPRAVVVETKPSLGPGLNLNRESTPRREAPADAPTPKPPHRHS